MDMKLKAKYVAARGMYGQKSSGGGNNAKKLKKFGLNRAGGDARYEKDDHVLHITGTGKKRMRHYAEARQLLGR